MHSLILITACQSVNGLVKSFKPKDGELKLSLFILMDDSNNGAIDRDSDRTTTQYNTHWHLRIRNPTDLFLELLFKRFEDLFEGNSLQYAVVAKETCSIDGGDDEVQPSP